MRFLAWAHARMGRLLAALFSIGIYLLLLVVDGLRFFPHTVTNASSLFRFGFSAFIALAFLAVGILVWLYARNRLVALLLFCFSFTLMATFAVQTGAALNDPVLSAIGTTSSPLSLLLFSVLLLLFPRNYLQLDVQRSAESENQFRFHRNGHRGLLYLYIAALTFIGIVVAISYALSSLQIVQLPDWSYTISYSYYLLVMIGILTTIVVIYRKASSLRERQQLRLFVIGIILTFGPFLVLTLLPLLVHLPPRYVVDSQLSVLTAIFLPMALGYSILRYQILVFDRYIQRAVGWIVGGVSLAVLGYLVVIASDILLSKNPLALVICVTVVMVVLAPFVWWLAKVVTAYLFFSEMAHYRRLIDTPDLLDHETLDLDEASRLLTVAAVNVFETSEVCLFVLDEDTGYYQLYPRLKEDDLDYASRSRLLEQLLHTAQPSLNEGVGWLEAHDTIIDRIATARRPLLLSEALRNDGERPIGLGRYITTESPEGLDPLLAPVWTQGKMIGILILGERGDGQSYAGPDFEAIHLILARFSPVVETARLYAQASKHVAILNTFYSATAAIDKTFQTIEDVAVDYARIAAEAVMAGAEIWLYDSEEKALRYLIHAGPDPRLTPLERLSSLQESDWSAYFCEGDYLQARERTEADTSTVGANDLNVLRSAPLSPLREMPSCLPEMPNIPFAWIPLNKGEKHLGMLVLTYPRPHHFSQEEKRVLGMFASQCAATMENAKMTLELLAAYERQKELDRLKDQFIMTASHELRTPLTAVQGYIELLEEYNQLLAPEARAEFIAKAHRGCEELVLMVGNIMDASRVEVDAENIRLAPISLAESVQHILEILEGITKRENRSVEIDVPSSLLVMAEDLRLRQVLLNLVSNALKYSPPGSPIAISADAQGEDVTLHVRDAGLGVPLEGQQHLFERFMRLERDMNSPIRGAGLGLYISKQLIEAMGGHIWVESTGQPGKGSTFSFTLKRAIVSQEIHQEIRKAQEV